MFYLGHENIFWRNPQMSSDITSTVLEWMPLIITFAMLGMVLGLLKKFGKI